MTWRQPPIASSGDDEPFDRQVLPNEYLTDPKRSQTFVYVSTIQRMAQNLFGAEGCFAQSGGDSEAEADADKLDIPIHAFDLIIADECHRGYTAQEMSVWRETLNHFDAIKIGLTATPAPHLALAGNWHRVLPPDAARQRTAGFESGGLLCCAESWRSGMTGLMGKP